LLEHTTDLCGLFRLNADPGFLFGNRPAEVDVACRDLKIAIEIDGYHHFTDPDHYRRDRRKDLELQKNGYFVLRFLAEDVVPEMATILKTIRDVVQSRVLYVRT
jgi:very-short-patch-repair endonuclease